MELKWSKYDDKFIAKTHGDFSFYRDMYEGNHGALFPRAQQLIANGEITDRVEGGINYAKKVRTPYIVANLSKMIPDITATFVSRSIGGFRTGHKPTENEDAKVNAATDDLIDGTDDETTNGVIKNVQQELINQIMKDSNLGIGEHWSNIVQQQVDGGLVGVPIKDDNGIRIEFKSRDVYFPHPDGRGVDLGYYFEDEVDGKIKKFLHVLRERLEGGNLTVRNIAFRVDGRGRVTEIEDEDEAREVLGIVPGEDLEILYEGRGKFFAKYWANDRTFMNPLGVSVLKGQESKQDEINWTLTRNAIVFERNGKPRIAVSKEVFAALQQAAVERYGEGNENKIDSDDLEVTTLDDNGNALQVIQIDVSKIGTFENVKNYMKLMLMETQTSEKAIDFYMEGSSGAAVSGVAKYYDLIMTIIKSQRIQQEYTEFLKDLIESALWLANKDDAAVIIERPEVELLDMIPLSKKEIIDANVLAFEKGTQSLETTVRRMNEGASEEWIETEVERIELAKQSSDTSSLSGTSTLLANALDNRMQGQEAGTLGTTTEDE